MGEVTFRGFDWTELAPVFNIPITEEDDSSNQDILAGKIRVALNELGARISMPSKPNLAKKQVAQVREFVRVLALQSRGHHYDTPLWEGLGKIEDDWTFLQHTALLLETMWT